MLDLDAIEARAVAATPGPWFARATDDDMNMNARYVSTDPGKGPAHDGLLGMGADARPGEVVAITLLQYPARATHEAFRWDEDAEFIAHAREDVPALVAEVRKLRGYLRSAANNFESFDPADACLLARQYRAAARGEDPCGTPASEDRPNG